MLVSQSFSYWTAHVLLWRTVFNKLSQTYCIIKQHSSQALWFSYWFNKVLELFRRLPKSEQHYRYICDNLRILVSTLFYSYFLPIFFTALIWLQADVHVYGYEGLLSFWMVSNSHVWNNLCCLGRSGWGKFLFVQGKGQGPLKVTFYTYKDSCGMEPAIVLEDILDGI